MDKIPLTKEGFARLEAKLKTLKSVERPAVIRAIAEALEDAREFMKTHRNAFKELAK